MNTETDQFVINEVQWKYSESCEISGGRNRSPPIRTGVLSAFVTCKKCASFWIATAGGNRGQFVPTISHILINCKSCASEETVSLLGLQRNGNEKS